MARHLFKHDSGRGQSNWRIRHSRRFPLRVPRAMSVFAAVARSDRINERWSRVRDYLPMQNSAKMRPSKSSAPNAPVISFKWCCARRRSSASSKPAQRQSVEVEMFAQHVARRARYLGDDGCVALREAIQQSRFAGVGAARDHHPHTVAQQTTLFAGGEQVLDVADERGQRGGDGHLAAEEIDLLFRKVDGRLRIRALVERLV